MSFALRPSDRLLLLTLLIALVDPEANFWKNLETCVSSKYDFDDTEMLISELQEMLEEKMKECSLDELERLAASIKPRAAQPTLSL